MDLCAAVDGLRQGRLRSVELVREAIAKARLVQLRHHCFLHIDAEGAMAAAEMADALLQGCAREGVQPPGALLGVPVAHKDMFEREGRVTTCASKVREPRVARRSATVVSRLDLAGVVDVGTLNMAEFALGATGHNATMGDCRNAWNPEFISGGSSSGSAVAVASGAVFASLGSDTGGSVRIPASANGVVGLKPTYGLIPRTGSMKLSPSIDVIGPMARSARDVALLLEVLAGADGLDACSSSRPRPRYTQEVTRGVEGLRIGVPRNYFSVGVAPVIRDAMNASLALLERAGARLVSLDVPEEVAAMAELSRAVVYAEATALHAQALRSRGDRYSPQVRLRASTGLGIPAPLYLEALQWRLPVLRRFVEQVFSRCDVLQTPTIPIPVPRRDETDVGAGPALWELLAQLVRCTAPFNYLGLPAISVPAGRDARGLPIGAQYAARPFAEAALLRVAAVQQHAVPLALPMPATQVASVENPPRK
jgi:aspartyl-tRNA(Asn)/glutamyl-tRNA(Gln) amidotransferase subunit A